MTSGVQILEWRDGAEVRPPDDLAFALSDPRTIVWVDLAGADPAVLHDLADQVGLDPRAVEDALTPGERPKASRHGDQFFVTCHASELVDDSPQLHDSRLVLHQVSAFALPHGVLTVRADDRFSLDGVRDRLRERPDLIAAGAAGLIHTLVDLVVDSHFDTIQEVDDVAEDVETDLFADRLPSGRVMQASLYRLHKELVHLRRAVLPLREVVGTLRRQFGESGPLAADFDDLYDHVMRASEWTESLRDMVSALFETHVSLLDARLNVVMKKLAGWAAVIAVPTAITGWFGQNVPFPGNGEPLGLVLSLGMIVALTLVVYVMLRRNDWI
ncbi:magnesium transporter CorA family protein [Ammonicoccus fulvus]|uniref:Magnesium transporter CorA family protein n=1 Tax=Ammonicoccus fulvus TaxID=3138240 RepID=A0ABZ3FLF6_9ACTN